MRYLFPGLLLFLAGSILMGEEAPKTMLTEFFWTASGRNCSYQDSEQQWAISTVGFGLTYFKGVSWGSFCRGTALVPLSMKINGKQTELNRDSLTAMIDILLGPGYSFQWKEQSFLASGGIHFSSLTIEYRYNGTEYYSFSLMGGIGIECLWIYGLTEDYGLTAGLYSSWDFMDLNRSTSLSKGWDYSSNIQGGIFIGIKS